MITVQLKGNDPSGFAGILHAAIQENLSTSKGRFWAKLFRGEVILIAREGKEQTCVKVSRKGDALVVEDVECTTRRPYISMSYSLWTESVSLPYKGPLPLVWRSEFRRLLVLTLKGKIELKASFHLLRILALLGITTFSM